MDILSDTGDGTVYGASMIVPLVGPLICEAMYASGDFEPFERQLLARYLGQVAACFNGNLAG